MSNDEINRFIGKNIKLLRKSKGLTLLELANRVGLSEGNVQRYESGNIANVSISVLLKFASALNVHPSHILGWDKDGTISPTLTDVEKAILSKYRKLSPAGKKEVDHYLDFRLSSEAPRVEKDSGIFSS